MKIVVIGGSSFSTPNLLTFLHSNNGQKQMHVLLAGRSRRRLEAVERASRVLCAGNLQINTEVIEKRNWQQILEGADCVIIQIRVGGFSGRLFDETFPNKFGLCGDEGLGVGGLSAGWRTWPVLMAILEAIASFCPQALSILLTSPLSVLVRASLQHVPVNLVGICELPWTTLRQISCSLGLETSEIECDYIGSNHFGWFCNVRRCGRELWEELATRKCFFPTSDFLGRYRCFPTRYLRLHYEAEQVLAEQIAEKPRRADALKNFQNRAYEAYESGQLAEIKSALRNRSTPWYGEAVGPLLLAVDGGRADIPFFLSVPNGDYVSFLNHDDVIECQHQFADGGLVRSRFGGECPRHVIDNLTRMVEFERAATNAIVNRSPHLLESVIAIHPWVRDHSQLRQIVEEIVSTNKAIMRMERDYEGCSL